MERDLVLDELAARVWLRMYTDWMCPHWVRVCHVPKRQDARAARGRVDHLPHQEFVL
jgi:hypothetical protein